MKIYLLLYVHYAMYYFTIAAGGETSKKGFTKDSIQDMEINLSCDI